MEIQNDRLTANAARALTQRKTPVKKRRPLPASPGSDARVKAPAIAPAPTQENSNPRRSGPTCKTFSAYTGSTRAGEGPKNNNVVYPDKTHGSTKVIPDDSQPIADRGRWVVCILRTGRYFDGRRGRHLGDSPAYHYYRLVGQSLFLVHRNDSHIHESYGTLLSVQASRQSQDQQTTNLPYHESPPLSAVSCLRT